MKTIIATSLVAVTLAAVVLAQPAKEPEPRHDIVIKAGKVKDAATLEDADAKAWRKASATKVPLQPQLFVEPFQQTEGTREVTVRALSDGKTLALLLQWRDADASQTVNVNRMGDACAVMFPGAKALLPSVMMGEHGKPVRIYHWKSEWQKPRQADERLWVDVYPMTGQAGPIRPDSAIHNTPAKEGVGGWAANNPLSAPEYKTFVEEMVAEGPGTITHRSFDSARGRGGNKAGAWRVTLLVPAPGESPSPVAFSIWQGQNSDVGGRKSLSPWVFLESAK